jgi:hypothetical protein
MEYKLDMGCIYGTAAFYSDYLLRLPNNLLAISWNALRRYDIMSIHAHLLCQFGQIIYHQSIPSVQQQQFRMILRTSVQ